MNEEKRNILLVDDDPDFLEPVRMLLDAHGYTVAAAHSEEGALKCLETFKPDLAILDLMMDHYDSGFIVGHKLKGRYPGAKVIIATGVTGETGYRFAADSEYGGNWTGADLIMDKGIRPDQILREIKRLLGE